MAESNYIKAKHDWWFWIIIIAFAFIIGLLTGCAEDCGCNEYPEITAENEFEIIAWDHFKTPKYGLKGKEGKYLGEKNWDIYKIKYQGHYYIVWGRPGSEAGYSVTLDPLHESISNVSPLGEISNHEVEYDISSEYNRLFGKE